MTCFKPQGQLVAEWESELPPLTPSTVLSKACCLEPWSEHCPSRNEALKIHTLQRAISLGCSPLPISILHVIFGALGWS